MSHPSIANHRPQPPADAYHLVASMLPERYFTEPPPLAGVIVAATGSDGRRTEWAMGKDLAAGVVPALRGRGVKVRTAIYDRQA